LVLVVSVKEEPQPLLAGLPPLAEPLPDTKIHQEPGPILVAL
jgi:hypothetical protein